MSTLDSSHLTERRWDLVEDEKIWARTERYRREGPEGCVRAAEELRRVAGDRGDAHARAQDLRDHIAWRLLLDRIDEGAAR